MKVELIQSVRRGVLGTYIYPVNRLIVKQVARTLFFNAICFSQC